VGLSGSLDSCVQGSGLKVKGLGTKFSLNLGQQKALEGLRAPMPQHVPGPPLKADAHASPPEYRVVGFRV